MGSAGWGRHELAIRFDPVPRELVVPPAGSEEAVRLPIKGLSVAELMGARTPLA